MADDSGSFSPACYVLTSLLCRISAAPHLSLSTKAFMRESWTPRDHGRKRGLGDAACSADRERRV
eukprot:750086-Hanusia_phi.AAC.5